MSWLRELSDTYDNCFSDQGLQEIHRIAPPFHVVQQAHLEICIDGDGVFRRAHIIEREDTIIPATERSTVARTSGVVPHPLCDHIKYVAQDSRPNPKLDTNRYFDAFVAQLTTWCDSAQAHPKATAVLKYIRTGQVQADLGKAGVIAIIDGHVQDRIIEGHERPQIFSQLNPKQGVYPVLNALIRWRVEVPNDPVSEVWLDSSLQEAWVAFCQATASSKKGLSFVTGDFENLADKHPIALGKGSKAKLISNKTPDASDFVYLGRFLSARQAVGIDLQSSLKAHSALRWLVARQGTRISTQCFVAWTPTGQEIPDPLRDSRLFLETECEETESTSTETHLQNGDVGQAFAIRLRTAMAGYGARLSPSSTVILLAIDAATEGRLAVTYFRRLLGTDFLARVEAWHSHAAWHQKYGKDHRFIGAPSPKDVAEAAYGSRLDEKLKKATVERLVPCIIDAARIPIDLIRCLVNRTANRVGLENWEFEKNLGIACAMFRAYSHSFGKDYEMVLEVGNRSRDYLYGRLLAIAEHLESRALFLADESRDTNAARQMHRFADRPFTTWQQIELSLGPYRSQLRSKRPVTLNRLDRDIDEVMDLFETDEFKTDAKLTGEFLLAYHCQRRALWNNNSASETEGKD